MTGPEKIRIRGDDVRAFKSGAGETLLFLHDATGAGGETALLTALAKHHAVLAPEHPGYGGGDPPPWLDRIADFANFYLDFLDTLDLKRVHLVGSSLGGWIAAELATRNATRLASLTLIDPLGLKVEGIAGIDPFVTNDEKTIRDLFFDQKIAGDAVARLLAPDSEDALLKNKMVTARVAWQPRLHDPHLKKWLHRITLPTLIVWGENDLILPKAYAAEWARAIPGAKSAVVPAAGHLPHLEKPGEVAGLISDFIATRRAA